MFELFTLLIAALVIAGVVWAISRARDTLHPLVYLLPMAAFLYVYMPVRLSLKGGLQPYFTPDELVYVQGLNLIGILALLLGSVFGSKGLRRDAGRIDFYSFTMTPHLRRVFLRMGIAFGCFGLLMYAIQLYNVGGFVEAYNTVKGGGWAGSGYIRDLDYMLVPSIVLVYLSRTDEPLRLRHWMLVGLFSFPYAARGLLTARRGPTFLFFAVLFGGWYLTRRRRPSLPTVAVGGSLIGLLLLALVTFRGQIYLGSSFLTGEGPPVDEIVDASLEWATTPSLLNEYMYGTYVVMNAREEEGHYYGRRYLTQAFVRPIPSSIWPNKYEAVGMEEIKFNAGQLLTADANEHPNVPKGAAPGFVASAYVEWGAWGAPLFLFGIGWLYALMWRKSLVKGGVWTVTYVIFLGMSAYFVAQSFYAIFYRLLLMGVPPAVVWYMLRPRARPRLEHLRQKSVSPASS